MGRVMQSTEIPCWIIVTTLTGILPSPIACCNASGAEVRAEMIVKWNGFDGAASVCVGIKTYSCLK